MTARGKGRGGGGRQRGRHNQCKGARTTGCGSVGARAQGTGLKAEQPATGSNAAVVGSGARGHNAHRFPCRTPLCSGLHLATCCSAERHPTGAPDACNRAHRPAHATPDVQCRLAGAQADGGCRPRLVRHLAGRPVAVGQLASKVEALAPAPLVQVGDQRVKLVHQVSHLVCGKAAHVE